MKRLAFRPFVVLGFAALAGAATTLAQIPDHPIVTEVFTDPAGASDGPVGRDPANLHQEYVEIYLPTAAGLNPGLNKDALRLAFYEVEGDQDSSGYTLVNYRIDLPTFDLDPSNGTTAGAIARPASGVVLLGWVDYVGNPPTALAGTPSTRVAMVNGGVTSTTDYTFVAMNGGQFGGTTNFPVPAAISYINMPAEAASGMIQNGSGVYMLVNRDAVGYVALTDDEDPAGGNHTPSLSTNTVLRTTCFLDGCGSNDSGRFDITDQPSNDGNNDNFDNLPPSGAYSLLICQVGEEDVLSILPGLANGYARRFIDVRKTTETGTAGDDNPVTDAMNAYRQIRNVGPFFPTPGRVVRTTDAGELGVASAAEQSFTVLPGTTARVGLACANAGGNNALNISAAMGPSGNPAVATFAGGPAAGNVGGQTVGLPKILVSADGAAANGATASATATVTATNVNGAAPPVVGAVQNVTATATVLSPSAGRNAAGAPFQTTVYLAIQPVASGPAINEFAGTSLGQYVAANLGGAAQDWHQHGAALVDPSTNIASTAVMTPMIQEFPGSTAQYINPPGPAGRLNLAQTVVNSAEQVTNATYDDSFNPTFTALKAFSINVPDTLTSGGAFSPTEAMTFVDPVGSLPTSPRSGLMDVTTTRTFEVAILDTNVRLDGTVESGATDDFGLLVEALDVEPGSPVLPGEFVFLSYTGGMQGADVDSLQSPLVAGDVLMNVIYLDLDNLHTVLGIRSIERFYIVDGNGGSDADVVEAFSLNPIDAGVAPSITQQPADLTVRAPQGATFSVVADGTAPLSYQWRKGGADISGATGASYSIPATTFADGGSYDVVVTNSAGSVTSNAALLTVRVTGDMNCDGLVDNGDIDAFVLALLDPATYAGAFPDCDVANGDVNGDTFVDNGDIDAFVQCLLAGGCL